MNKPWTPVDYLEEGGEFIHVNPNLIANVKIIPTVGNFFKEFPFTVETLILSFTGLEVVEYLFKTKPEAKEFIRKLGGVS